MSSIECPICKSNTDNENSFCSRCGDFSISGTAAVMWNANEPSLKQIANACGWIREHQNIVMSSDQIEFLLSIKLPSVAERATKILIAIENKITSISSCVDIFAHDLAGFNDSPEKDILRPLHEVILTLKTHNPVILAKAGIHVSG